MKLSEWAKFEIDQAKQGCDEYISSCYDSALKAYNSLLEDDHSGMSWSITRNILIRLILDLPLNPIEDVPENWNTFDGTIYQCNRMSSLFKEINSDGSVSYHDNNRAYVKDIKTGTTYVGPTCNIIDEMFPITMPYYPSVDKYVIEVEEFNFNNAEYKAVYQIVVPGKDNIKINKFYKNNELISKTDYQDAYSQKELINLKIQVQN